MEAQLLLKVSADLKSHNSHSHNHSSYSLATQAQSEDSSVGIPWELVTKAEAQAHPGPTEFDAAF